MTTLDRAFALSKMDAVSMLIGEHLDLDVPRAFDVTLDVNAPFLNAANASA
jgi:hypothetical protein